MLLVLTAFGLDVEVVVPQAGLAKKTGGIRFRREAA
jgi:hypothetical protein